MAVSYERGTPVQPGSDAQPNQAHDPSERGPAGFQSGCGVMVWESGFRFQGLELRV